MDFFLYILFALVWLGVGCVVTLILGATFVHQYQKLCRAPNDGILLRDVVSGFDHPFQFMLLCLVWPVCALFLIAGFGADLLKWCEQRFLLGALGRLIAWPPGRWGLRDASNTHRTAPTVNP